MLNGVLINDTMLLDSIHVDSSLMKNIGVIKGYTPDVLINFQGSETIILDTPDQSWYFFFIVALIIAYVIARLFLGQILSSAFFATIRYSATLSMYNDNSQVQNQRDKVLYAFFFVSISFFILILEKRMNFIPFNLSEAWLYIFNFGVLLTFYIFRRFLLRLVGFLFEKQGLFKEYLYHNFSYNKLLGIIFIPINFLLIYTQGIINNVMVLLSISIIFIIIIMKISRGLVFSLRHRVFSFYLFLYLCALEMVPVILLCKWFSTLA